MIHMQLLEGVLLALAILVGAAIIFSVAMLAAAKVAKPAQSPRGSQPPHGGIRRDLPQHPQGDTDDARTEDDARELMLV